MKRILTVLMATSMCLSCNRSHEAGTPEAAVAAAVESFREVMLHPDQEVFEGLFDEALSYGHSNGLIEDRATCIASMVGGKYKFTSMELSEQTIHVVGNTAIVRHTLFGHTHDGGKEPGTIHLKVLQAWVQKEGKWQLLARQAVRI